MGRDAMGIGAEVAVSEARMGKEKSGFGRSSIWPAFEGWRRWYSGEPMPADCDCVAWCRGSAI